MERPQRDFSQRLEAHPTLDIQDVQRLRKRALVIGLVPLVALAVISQPVRGFPPILHALLEDFGVALIIMAILGRGWCALYIAGRKKRVLVDRGPYSLMRNPLYSFTFLGTIGIGLQFGGVTFALLGMLVVWPTFLLVVLQEEKYLLAKYGPVYADYKRRVPRFLPRLSGWQDEALLVVQPKLVLRTFIDASLFLLAFPLFEGLEALHAMGWLPVLLSLY